MAKQLLRECIRLERFLLENNWHTMWNAHAILFFCLKRQKFPTENVKVDKNISLQSCLMRRNKTFLR